MGKILVLIGISLAFMGVLVMIAQKYGDSGWFSWFGNLPLDIRIEKENFRLYFPLGSSIIISIILSLILFLIGKIIR